MRMKKILILLFVMPILLFAQGKVLYNIGFTKQKDGDALTWLQKAEQKHLSKESLFTVRIRKKR